MEELLSPKIDTGGSYDTTTTRKFFSASIVAVVWIFTFSFLAITTDIARIRPIITSISDGNIEMRSKIDKMVTGYPIESMTPLISRKNPTVAAYLVAIAKKESNWGKRKPVSGGIDCFNYWGFRAKTPVMSLDGHSCFSSPKEAVDAVANRLNELIFTYQRDEPDELSVWKCGYSCAGHSQESVRKWIADISFYKSKIEQ